MFAPRTLPNHPGPFPLDDDDEAALTKKGDVLKHDASNVTAINLFTVMLDVDVDIDVDPIVAVYICFPLAALMI